MEQQIEGCLKVSSPSATGMNHNPPHKWASEPGLLGAYKYEPAKIP